MIVFFFKQKTAYELRISDWSSDVCSSDLLFAGTSVGFIASALLVTTTVLPHRKAAAKKVEGIWLKTTRGMRIYLNTPRLVGLLAVTLAAAAGSAMVIVNTVVLVKEMGRTQGEVALALAAYGGGSMLAALALPSPIGRASGRARGCQYGLISVVAGH